MSDIAELIREAKRTAFLANQKLNEYADGIHEASTDAIQTNGGGVDELGGIVSDLATSIDDLATTLSELSEKLTNLEGSEAK